MDKHGRKQKRNGNRRGKKVSDQFYEVDGRNHENRSDQPLNEFKRKKVPPIVPLTEVQSHYMEAIRTKPYILATGYAGTGKTYIPIRMAIDLLIAGDIKHIVLARPAVSNSKSLGFFKGSKEEKMAEWLKPIMSTLQEQFSDQKIDTMIKYKELVFCPLETIKGNNWKDSFIIIDEDEDCNFEEIKSIITRLGTDSTMVLCGDITQSSLRNSGVVKLLEAREKSVPLQKIITHIDFSDIDDIVRSIPVKTVITELEKLGL